LNVFAMKHESEGKAGRLQEKTGGGLKLQASGKERYPGERNGKRKPHAGKGQARGGERKVRENGRHWKKKTGLHGGCLIKKNGFEPCTSAERGDEKQ